MDIQPNTAVGTVFGLAASWANLLIANTDTAVNEDLTWKTAVITMIIGALGALGGFIMTGLVKWIRYKAVPTVLSSIVNFFKGEIKR